MYLEKKKKHVGRRDDDHEKPPLPFKDFNKSEIRSNEVLTGK